MSLWWNPVSYYVSCNQAFAAGFFLYITLQVMSGFTPGRISKWSHLLWSFLDIKQLYRLFWDLTCRGGTPISSHYPTRLIRKTHSILFCRIQLSLQVLSSLLTNFPRRHVPKSLICCLCPVAWAQKHHTSTAHGLQASLLSVSGPLGPPGGGDKAASCTKLLVHNMVILSCSFSQVYFSLLRLINYLTSQWTGYFSRSPLFSESKKITPGVVQNSISPGCREFVGVHLLFLIVILVIFQAFQTSAE